MRTSLEGTSLPNKLPPKFFPTDGTNSFFNLNFVEGNFPVKKTQYDPIPGPESVNISAGVLSKEMNIRKMGKNAGTGPSYKIVSILFLIIQHEDIFG
jgi:hypothetical protein